jgi:hypothetical protein
MDGSIGALIECLGRRLMVLRRLCPLKIRVSISGHICLLYSNIILHYLF